MSDLILRPASETDIPVIIQLADRIWKEHYSPIIGLPQVEYMLTKSYSSSSIREQMESGERFFLAYENKIPIGYISVLEKNDGEYFLHKFYIEMKEQGRGLGKKIFGMMVEKFPACNSMRLQVNRLNFKAINFYFKLGFTIEYAKNFDIGEGYSMDDYMMILRRK
ncbi:MAG: GNAT family N-acetyltransferase [Bacteroidetes bacterium]|nr:GNAT family N-acetyltransferase [Bacteroidota bacterium]